MSSSSMFASAGSLIRSVLKTSAASMNFAARNHGFELTAHSRIALGVEIIFKIFELFERVAILFFGNTIAHIQHYFILACLGRTFLFSFSVIVFATCFPVVGSETECSACTCCIRFDPTVVFFYRDKLKLPFKSFLSNGLFLSIK